VKPFFNILGKTLTLVATWVSFISLRGLVVILGVFLALLAPRNDLLNALDRLVLTGGSYLYSAPLGSSGIALVSVPTEELSIWQSDIHSSGKLAALLSNILNSSDATVGLVLEQPIDTGSGAADTLIESFSASAQGDLANKEAKALVDRKFLLMDFLKNERVVVGVEQYFFAGQKPMLREPGWVQSLPGPLPHLVSKACAECFEASKAYAVGRPVVNQFTIVDDQAAYVQAVFPSDKGEIFNGFFLQLLKAIESVPHSENLVWMEGLGVDVGSRHLPLSSQGRFIPLHGLSDRLSPIINVIPLNEALARSAFPGTIIIARDGSTHAAALAQAIFSVRENRVLHTPWWAGIGLILVTFIATLYLGFVVTKLSVRIATAVTFMLAFGVLVAQLVLLSVKGLWLPMAMPLAWLLMGHFLLVVWVIKKRRVRQLVDRADDICIENARELIVRQELDSAVELLQDCTPRDKLLQTLYDISEAFTERKDYANAIEVLTSIKDKKQSFKDTEQKLQVLNTMLKGQASPGASADLQQTMVLAPSTEKGRMIGRYKVDKEIGRGAMGQVYLGFDPRISRRVAVKTLLYEQFKGKEQSSIKERFFREAEAAGRLNHPSIVSVFDVGEEPDLAFIAMDYADGQALNNFVNPDNLLPVFEVYRIVCDVAIALGYAHDNQIVHRDIKPGNIIYNPVPYQVKVTDFGIARLVDNSKTSTGEILGSPLYMAPEQLKGKKVNRSADIFSLGVTFYQLLTGVLPYTGDNLAALTYEIIHGKHKSVRSVRRDLPASASRIINQALQKHPEDRYETAAEMASVLKKAIKRDFAAEAKRIGYI